MNLEETEQEARAVAKTSNRVSLADIEAKIAQKFFLNGEDIIGDEPYASEAVQVSLPALTICIAVTDTGFTVIGKSAPVDPQNFDAELGQKLAYEDVLKQLWQLMGFALRERLYNQ